MSSQCLGGSFWQELAALSRALDGGEAEKDFSKKCHRRLPQGTSIGYSSLQANGRAGILSSEN
jgi:hypothetical protein